MLQFLINHGLDIFTTVLGLWYIWLEYRVNIMLWFVGIIMPALDIYLYWSHGLYGDACMAGYYTAAAVYGYTAWRWGVRMNITFCKRVKCNSAKDNNTSSAKNSISHIPVDTYLPILLCFCLAWGTTFYILTHFTNSTVPVLDSFTNALSFIALWALSRKYVEQWLLWIIVDAVCMYLYIVKGIPFKALLYTIYIIIAIAGYRKWSMMAHTTILRER